MTNTSQFSAPADHPCASILTASIPFPNSVADLLYQRKSTTASCFLDFPNDTAAPRVQHACVLSACVHILLGNLSTTKSASVTMMQATEHAGQK